MPDTFVELHRRINALERQVNSLSRRAKAHGWQLPSSFDMHRYGGGRLMWQFDGHSVHVGSYNTIWAETNIAAANYDSSEVGGGPYVRLNGTDEYLTIADAAWQETGAEEFFVWGWCYAESLSTTNRTIAAKYLPAGNQRSWQLYYDLAATDFAFICNATGPIGGDVTVTSTYSTVAIEGWYFVAGYYEANSLMRIYVGHNTDTALVVDSLAVGVPVTLFDGNADLTIGANDTPAEYWDGEIGIMLGRANIPVGNIDNHANMLFKSTQPFYTEEHPDALLLEASFILMENWQKILLE